MGVEEWASLGGAIGIVPALQWLWKRLARDPKGDAEARKLNEEANDRIINRLEAEIDRLDREMRKVREELVTVRRAAVDEKRALEVQNKELRNRVSVLEEALADERDECARKLSEMEGHVRQLRQQQASYGRIYDKALGGSLDIAFPVDTSDKDADLLGKLGEVP